MTKLRVGGIVLCGGRSSRMGQPKALLPFGSERMLQRVVRIVRGCVDPVVVVAAPNQPLPPLPDSVLLTYDRHEGRGPLEGLLAGLTALQSHVEAAYATSCDVPLLAPQFVQHLVGLLDDEHDIVVPVEDRLHHPLAAVYRTSVAPVIAHLLAQDHLRPVHLFEQVRTHRISVDQLQAVDSQLHSLMNLNHWEDYQQALRIAGLHS